MGAYSPLLVGHLAIGDYPEGRRHARHADDGALVVGQLAQSRGHSAFPVGLLIAFGVGNSGIRNSRLPRSHFRYGDN